MTYKLRVFNNNFQIINSLGWVLIIMSLIFLLIKGMPGVLIFAVVGGALIWLQLHGKRTIVDTSEKIVKSGSKVHRVTNPSLIFMNEVRVAQNVNSRVSTTSVQSYFYKAYLHEGEEKILLSSNRKEDRDLETLKSISKDLGIPFVKNY
ncbi:MAG: hypothetical protein AAF363_07545 [Bacteroidota bacterium]